MYNLICQTKISKIMNVVAVRRNSIQQKRNVITNTTSEELNVHFNP
jgi:hypothetical protein